MIFELGNVSVQHFLEKLGRYFYVRKGIGSFGQNFDQVLLRETFDFEGKILLSFASFFMQVGLRETSVRLPLVSGGVKQVLLGIHYFLHL